MKRRILSMLVAFVLVASGCSFGTSGEDRVVTAHFSRAVQMFPGNSVRVLGVEIGRVLEVENDDDSVAVTFRIDDPDIVLPADVNATIVPVSLLGERYVQLLPAYDGGEKFDSDTIPIERTSVPTEGDELLRGLQDYFGALDPEKVAEFVSDAAQALEGNGEHLNDLINYGSGVISTLNRKRDSLAKLFSELNTITQALATRQQKLGRLIHSYNDVTSTINDNRSAVAGTIDGLNEAAAELASLLIAHRNPLGADVRTLTRTGRTLSKNVHRFARTGKWAKRLFGAAERAVDYKEDWLRLSNQGGQTFEAIQYRLRDRLVGVCIRLEILKCDDEDFFNDEFPDLFCRVLKDCDKNKSNQQNLTPGQSLERSLRNLDGEVGRKLRKELGLQNRNCKKARHPKRCRERKRRALDPGERLDELLDGIGDQLDDELDGLGELGGS